MAHLLGSKSCLDSLRQDVLDLHTTISETVSCGGAIRVSSWKYPDKLASEVNISELLDDYVFVPNEIEDNQVAHIIMYELVIDRLVYLLHLATSFVSSTLDGNSLSDSMSQYSATSRCNSAVGRLPSMSTGLVVKKLWMRISALKKQFEESKEANQKLNANVEVLEDALEKVTLDYLEATRTDPQERLDNRSASQMSTINNGCLQKVADDQMIPEKLLLNGSPDSYHGIGVMPCGPKVCKACQTLDTAFITCNDCSILQSKLTDTSETVSLICQHLGVRTHSGRFLKARDSDGGNRRHLSVQEIEKLSNELSRDLNAVLKKCNDQNKRLEEFADETDDMRRQISGLSEQTRSLNETLDSERKTAQQEISLMKENVRISEEASTSKILELNSNIEQLRNIEKELRGEIVAVTEERENFFGEVEMLKSENDDLERKKAELKVELQNAQEEISHKEEEMKKQEDEIFNLKKKVSESEQSLKQEKVKTKQNSNREGEMQSKQENLIIRLEELDEECESLKQQLSEAEITRDDAHHQLSVTQREVTTLKKKLKDQNQTIENLEKENVMISEQLKSYESELQTVNSEIESLKEKQDMLILFPDLTEVPSKPSSTAPPNLDPNDPRYLKYEMQQQIFANTLRISKLDELNQSLRNSLTKMEAIIPKDEPSKVTSSTASTKASLVSQNMAPVKMKDPVSLISESQINHFKTEHVAISRNASKSNLQSRGRAEQEDDNTASVKYLSAGSSSASMDKVPTRPVSARSKKGVSGRQGSASAVASSGKPPLSARSFHCTNCARSFKSTHELQMHSNFCC